MFGIIFHWGLYSVPAFFPVREAKGLNNGSEWYLKRLMEKGTFRPISKWKETQEFHKKEYGDKRYEDFKDLFLAEKWNPDEWMELCKSVGATYVILTSKHHDGFCLWDTKSTNYNSVKSGPKRDIIKEFGESAKKYNLRFGVYYSWSEFGIGCTKDYMNSVVLKQVDELLTYNPDIWWFDGDWTCTTKYSNDFISNICKKIKKQNPNVEINDRLGGSKEIKEKREDMNFLGDATYRSYGDREIPSDKPEVAWEHINTIGYSWGRNKQQEEKHYKTSRQLKELYDKVTALNGRFLLNMGPNSDGTLDEKEVESLKGFGKLLKPDGLNQLNKKSEISPIFQNRVKGMLYGLALGDALGVSTEFFSTSPKMSYDGYIPTVQFEIRFNAFYALKIYPGSISDDTEMSLALLRGLLSNDMKYDRNIILKNYMEFANSRSGLGTNTRRLFKNVTTIKGYESRFKKINEDEKPNMQSNGSLMRASPLALIPNFIDSIQAMKTDVYLTNPNDINLEIGFLYNSFLSTLLRGKDKDSIIKAIELYKNIGEVEKVKDVFNDLESSERDVCVKNVKGWVVLLFI